jgi:hypothetical protein
VLGGWLGVELTCDNFKDATRELVPRWIDAASEPAA